MNLYISDMHFGHKNVIDFDKRPFAGVEEMDTYIMQCWNARVQPDDTVYIVGDLCYRSQKGPEWYLKRLRGHKVLILGNHDVPILNNKEASQYLEGIEKRLHDQPLYPGFFPGPGKE